MRLLLGARRDGPTGAETLPLDLSRLDSVRSFAGAVDERLHAASGFGERDESPEGIHALVLNAGVSRASGDDRTSDGFEMTFGVNHLAHYLLLRLLLPRLVHGATVIATTSGTHDPAERTLLPPPRHADASLLAHPECDPDRPAARWAAGGYAYSSSKLCNVLTMRALAAHPTAKERRLTAIAYDPGPTPGTGLVRDSGFAINLLWRVIWPGLRVIVPRFNGRKAVGGALADLALGLSTPPAGRMYAAVRRGRLTWREPSELARRDDVMERLWRDSAALVGVPES